MDPLDRIVDDTVDLRGAAEAVRVLDLAVVPVAVVDRTARGQELCGGGRERTGEDGRGREREKRRPKSACMHVRLCYSTGYNIAFLYSCALNAPNSSFFALHSPRFFLMYDSPFDPHMWSVINALSRSGASSRLPNKRKRREKEKKRKERKGILQ